MAKMATTAKANCTDARKAEGKTAVTALLRISIVPEHKEYDRIESIVDDVIRRKAAGASVIFNCFRGDF